MPDFCYIYKQLTLCDSMLKHRATIKDIARELNISPSTVSRALADRWDVNPETRRAVLEVAERLHYHPNPISLSLKQRQTMSIGVIVPEFFNSFFAEVITGIQEVMEPQGYHILISQSNEIAATELKNLLAMDAKMVDGIIISVTQDSESADFLTQLQEKRVPLVFFNRLCPGVEAPHVIFEDYKWAFNAVEHLIRQGYKRIAHLAGPKRLLLSQERERGYRNALQAHGVSAIEELVIPGGISMESGQKAAAELLKMHPRPDAVFAVNDPAEIGMMKTLQKAGIRIPDEIAFVGFSESQSALIIEPNLTSVAQPTFEMGRVAAKLLLEQIRNYSETIGPHQSISLQGKLNIRESSQRKDQMHIQ